MKRWRVGTLSMGLSLVLIGVTLLLSAWSDAPALETLIDWWPVVFILLGLEIVVYLAVKGKEQTMLHYDIFSIFFVGVLCISCLGFSVAAASGVMQELRYSLSSEERTVDLPEVAQAIPADITRIVVQTNGVFPLVDRIAAREVHLFGNYRYTHLDDEDREPSPLTAADVATIRKVGQTLYISIKELPSRSGLNGVYPYAVLTMAIPKDIPVDVRSPNNLLEPLKL